MRYKILYAIIFFFLMIGIIFFNQTSAQERKADLIINYVSSIVKDVKMKTAPGQPVSSGDRYRLIEYTVTIKNIGTEEVLDAFYIFWTNNDSDIRTEHYSGGALVNKDKKIIPVGKSIEIKVDVLFSQYMSRSKKFLVNPDRKPKNRGYYPSIPELNYNNNTYMY